MVIAKEKVLVGLGVCSVVEHVPGMHEPGHQSVSKQTTAIWHVPS